MNRLFNSSFEVGLRILLTIYSSDSSGLSLDRITDYDFITVYGQDFNISKTNLHGTNQFRFSELPSRRAICYEGIKQFVLEGLLTVCTDIKGFKYSLTPAGLLYVESLNSDYKTLYLEICKNVHLKYHDISDTDLTKIINNAAIKAKR